MGWICRRCGSENPFSGRSCLACSNIPSRPYIFRQRFASARVHYLQRKQSGPPLVLQLEESPKITEFWLRRRNLVRRCLHAGLSLLTALSLVPLVFVIQPGKTAQVPASVTSLFTQRTVLGQINAKALADRALKLSSPDSTSAARQHIIGRFHQASPPFLHTIQKLSEQSASLLTTLGRETFINDIQRRKTLTNMAGAWSENISQSIVSLQNQMSELGKGTILLQSIVNGLKIGSSSSVRNFGHRTDLAKQNIGPLRKQGAELSLRHLFDELIRMSFPFIH